MADSPYSSPHTCNYHQDKSTTLGSSNPHVMMRPKQAMEACSWGPHCPICKNEEKQRKIGMAICRESNQGCSHKILSTPSHKTHSNPAPKHSVPLAPKHLVPPVTKYSAPPATEQSALPVI